MVGDYVGWIIGILGLGIGIYGIVRSKKADKKIKQLKNNSQQVHNTAKTIQQTTIYNNFPPEIQEKIKFIVSHTGSAIMIMPNEE